MNTLTHETPQRAAPGRPRRTWLIVLIAALAIAGIAIGIWAIIDANQSDDLAVASELADGLDVVMTTSDGEAAAALFTEDGVWKGASDATNEGRDAIRAMISGLARFPEFSHGEVTEVEDGVFTFPFRGVWIAGVIYEGEIQITLEGNLISYLDFVKWDQVYE